MVKIPDGPINALTVDVEDYFQVEAFARVVAREDWGKWRPRVERNTLRLLELFREKGVRATFFVLGWVARNHQGLVRLIAEDGHEVASHGYDHRLIGSQTPAEFRADVRMARDILEHITGRQVIGYRAPTYSINTQTMWALDILIEEGFRYDSSIFPIWHDRYGMPGGRREPHMISRESGSIVEFPPSTIRVAGLNLPVAGGGYFRLMPYSVFRRCLRRINRAEFNPAMFMVHAWEVDPGQPVIPGRMLNVWRHRLNLHRTVPRLRSLLDDFRFAPVSDVLELDDRAVSCLEPAILGSAPEFARMD